MDENLLVIIKEGIPSFLDSFEKLLSSESWIE